MKLTKVFELSCALVQPIGNDFYLYKTVAMIINCLSQKLIIMRHTLLSLLLLFTIVNSSAQDASKIAISNTGCTAEVFCFPGRFDVYDIEDESTVYASDCDKEGIMYGIYCVKLKKAIHDLDAAEDTIKAYLDFLKLDYGIVKAKGYDNGHKLNKDNNTRGIFDTWDDVDKNKWKVRAWTNGNFICIMHMHSQKEMPDKKVDVFLNGLRFPGMK